MLVLEDDVELDNDFDTKLKDLINSLPKGWQGLWLGGQPIGKKIDCGLSYRISATTGTYGYVVKRSFIPKLVAQLNGYKLADYAMSDAFENVYMAKQQIVKHIGHYSEIHNKQVNY